MFETKFLILLICGHFLNSFVFAADAQENVKVYTVASEKTDGYERFIRSAKYYNIDVQTLGLGQEWKGGDMSKAGGGYKINLLKEALGSDVNKNEIIVFSDSYDVVFTSNMEEILRKFKLMEAKIVFGGEHFCWPDPKLAKNYPPTAANAVRFLNSGMFMGYAPEVLQLLNDSPVQDTDDDQLYYTKVFLDPKKRKALGMKLDIKSEIFLNLNGIKEDVKLSIDSNTGMGSLQNIQFMTNPSLIHGNGPSKLALNAFANYLAGTFEKTCKICEENLLELDESNLPVVTLALFMAQPYPFLSEWFEKVAALNYPKKNINLFLYCNVPQYKTTDELAEQYLNKYKSEYLSAKYIKSVDDIPHGEALQLAVKQAEERKSDYLFVYDGDVHIDDPNTLRDLLVLNRGFIAPLLSKPESLWSNFWGDLSDSGFYARSHDYVEIVEKNIRGMWNVPYVSTAYLIRKDIFKHIDYMYNKKHDVDMSLCEKLRDSGIFMYIVNIGDYGHIVDAADFDARRRHPDFYMLQTNKVDWEKRYLHPEYINQLEVGYKQMQPCPDVFWFKIGTDKFCQDLIDIMNDYGKWSTGSAEDDRIEGGYENVPTRDIHMKQVGLSEMWFRYINDYIKPLSEAVFDGYYQKTHTSTMNFVVRYKPDEQPNLKPHHDASTYTVNIALNQASVDYEGGGCKFLRYNCSVTDTKRGWMLMHPGRLTHIHEGLTTVSGTRYIMISFINP